MTFTRNHYFKNNDNLLYIDFFLYRYEGLL